MKKCLDMTVTSVEHINEKYVLIKLTHGEVLPEMHPGQFVEVRVDGSPTTFLRRPISINNVDVAKNELHLLVAAIGDGTRKLAQLNAGDTLNVMLPLGNGFTMPKESTAKHLLVGGGVGVAPLLYLGKKIKEQGGEATFLLGARTAKDLLMIDDFKAVGRVFVTTEDGSEGEKGFVKGLITGLVSTIASFLIFGLIGGGLNFGLGLLIDFVCGGVMGGLSGAIAVNVKK